MEIETLRPSDLVIFKSHRYVVAQKPAGIASQANREGTKSLQDLLQIYLKHNINIITRIDQPVSGLCLYASNAKSAARLSELMRDKKIHKTYLALVEKAPPKREDLLVHFISRNAKNRKALINPTTAAGYKEAKLQYKLLKQFENYALLEIETLTGRFHQIRAQLAAIGCPIKGDVKYGARRSNKDRSIHLLSYTLSFKDPFNGEDKKFIADIPDTDGLWKDAAIHIREAQ